MDNKGIKVIVVTLKLQYCYILEQFSMVLAYMRNVFPPIYIRNRTYRTTWLEMQPGWLINDLLQKLYMSCHFSNLKILKCNNVACHYKVSNLQTNYFQCCYYKVAYLLFENILEKYISLNYMIVYSFH